MNSMGNDLSQSRTKVGDGTMDVLSMMLNGTDLNSEQQQLASSSSSNSSLHEWKHRQRKACEWVDDLFGRLIRLESDVRMQVLSRENLKLTEKRIEELIECTKMLQDEYMMCMLGDGRYITVSRKCNEPIVRIRNDDFSDYVLNVCEWNAMCDYVELIDIALMQDNDCVTKEQINELDDEGYSRATCIHSALNDRMNPRMRRDWNLSNSLYITLDRGFVRFVRVTKSAREDVNDELHALHFLDRSLTLSIEQWNKLIACVAPVNTFIERIDQRIRRDVHRERELSLKSASRIERIVSPASGYCDCSDCR